MNYKRITLLCGHYGSGKTNISVNMAFDLKKQRDNVAVADLDIVNPYFRSKDSSGELEHAGIRMIASNYANSNVDIPAMPQDMYSIVDDRNLNVILDVGGDERGALALGRISARIVEEQQYDMYLVINGYRPLTPDAESTYEVMMEIQNAARIPFTGIINNSNLGEETTAGTVLRSMAYAQAVSERCQLPLVMTTVRKDLMPELEGKIPNLFPLSLQPKL